MGFPWLARLLVSLLDSEKEICSDVKRNKTYAKVSPIRRSVYPDSDFRCGPINARKAEKEREKSKNLIFYKLDVLCARYAGFSLTTRSASGGVKTMVRYFVMVDGMVCLEGLRAQKSTAKIETPMD